MHPQAFTLPPPVHAEQSPQLLFNDSGRLHRRILDVVAPRPRTRYADERKSRRKSSQQPVLVCLIRDGHMRGRRKCIGGGSGGVG